MKVEEIASTLIKRFSRPRDYEKSEYLEAIEALKSLDSNVCQSIIQKVIPHMVKTFKDAQDHKAHLGAVDVLNVLGPEVLPPLIGNLKRKNVHTCWDLVVLSWASALYKKQAVPMLIRLMDDIYNPVATAADLHLCCIGSPNTKEAIRTFFHPFTGKNKSPSESQILAVIESIQDSSVERLNRKELTDKLLWILSQGADFLHEGLVPAREIGERLYKLGGKVAMQDAFRIIMAKPKYREHLIAAETLEAAWDGIGGWMA